MPATRSSSLLIMRTTFATIIEGLAGLSGRKSAGAGMQIESRGYAEWQNSRHENAGREHSK
jgi:hypothetical protein